MLKYHNGGRDWRDIPERLWNRVEGIRVCGSKGNYHSFYRWFSIYATVFWLLFTIFAGKCSKLNRNSCNRRGASRGDTFPALKRKVSLKRLLPRKCLIFVLKWPKMPCLRTHIPCPAHPRCATESTNSAIPNIAFYILVRQIL